MDENVSNSVEHIVFSTAMHEKHVK